MSWAMAGTSAGVAGRIMALPLPSVVDALFPDEVGGRVGQVGGLVGNYLCRAAIRLAHGSTQPSREDLENARKFEQGISPPGPSLFAIWIGDDGPPLWPPLSSTH